jgi:very-short-patch-repair endonuclease
MCVMSADLALLANTQYGVLLRRQVIAAGLDPGELRRNVVTRRWIAIRHGAYVAEQTWSAMSRVERHRAMCFAVAAKVRSDAALSHVSSIALHELPTWQHDLETVHVSRTSRSRATAGVFHHRIAVPPEHVTKVGPMRTTTVPRALIELATRGSYEASLVTADAAIHAGKTTREELRSLLDTMRDWPGARNAGRVVSFADGRAESPGESLARIALDRAGLPEPILQHDIRDQSGWLVARVDFYFPEFRTVVEFDGKIKYTGELTPDANPADVLWHEKRREDKLRELGYQVVRLTWSDCMKPAAVRAKVRAAFARSVKA